MKEQVETTLTVGHTRACIAPWRGGLISRLAVYDKPILFLRPESLFDLSLGIRGGIPLLFPFASRLAGNVLVESGTTLPMHGFARSMEWTHEQTGKGEARLVLESDDQTFAQYPWRFRLKQFVQLLEAGIELRLEIENRSDTAMPVAPGWHPYFPCAPEDKKRVSGNVAGTEAGCVTNEQEANFGVVPPADGRVAFWIPGTGTLRLSFSPMMRHLQIWSPVDEPFVCIEPFTGPPDFINTPATPRVPPRQTMEFFLRIVLDA